MNKELFNTVKELRDKGYTWQKIADKVNAMGHRTVTGLKFCNKGVANLITSVDPSYRTYKNKKQPRRTKTKTKTKTTNAYDDTKEAVFDFILSKKTLTVLERLEIVSKLV